jgi:hypothetical protein
MLRTLTLFTGLFVAGVANRAAASTNFAVINNVMSTWRINAVDNPTLTLTRGQTYNFVLDATAFGHPFWITTARGAEDAPANAWSTGVTNNGAAAGTTLTFVVPTSAPAALFYQCSFHEPMGGQLNIVNPVVSTPVPSIGPLAAAALAGLLLAVAVAILGRRARS